MFRAIFILLVTFILIITLNTKIGTIPPLGKFLSPATGFWQNAEKPGFTMEQQLVIDGLKDKVQVIYDSLMIPHIFAKNDHDLYLAQGYITARDRLWQMEFQTHFAAGRLSEIFGDNPRLLEIDRQHRRLGLTYGASKALNALETDTEIFTAIQAYAQGANAFINNLKEEDLPIEYKIFDYKPEPWSPFKTTLLLKYMANNLAGRDYDLESTNSLNLLGEELFNKLFPVRDPGYDPIIPAETIWDFAPGGEMEDSIFNVNEVVANILTMPDPDNGSNNWAVSGSKTASGNAILAGDPHLGLNLPSIWFAMQLNGPDINVMGATLPGAMGVIIGFNDSIAWSPTNARRDVKDWYKIKFKSEEKNEYWFDNEWRPTEKIIEEIKIRGQKPFYDTVTFTHHGPVVYDCNFMSDNVKHHYALRWIAHDPSHESNSFYLLNRANNYDDFQAAMSTFSCPAQNFAFASVNGDIAMQIQGKFPIKWKGQGKFLMDGSRKENDWNGFIPQEHIARVLNPERGFVSSANQFPVDSTYPYFTYDANFEHYRNRVINQSLRKMSDITVRDMMKLQNNNYNLKASESLPVMLKNLPSEKLKDEERRLVDTLRLWNYNNDAELVAPIIYQIWWNKFFFMLWDEFEDEKIKYRYPGAPQTVQILNNEPENAYFDKVSTPEVENMSDLLLESFQQVSSTIKQWQSNTNTAFNWWNYKHTTINHLVPAMSAFSIKDIKIGGGRSIINATKGDHGPSWKMIVDLGSIVKAWAVYPGGQSGNPGSWYYSNFIDTWSQGKYFPMMFLHNYAERNEMIIGNQLLEPSSK